MVNPIFNRPKIAKLQLVILYLLLASLFFACSPTTVQPKEGVWYQVREGETLDAIAQRFSVDVILIQRENQIYDARDIFVGMNIFIPRTQGIGVSPQIEAGRGQIRMIWPSLGTISSGFGKRQGRMHHGVDLTRDQGKDILAASSGVVEFLGVQSGYGRTIIIDHGNGIKTLYAHNEKFYTKKGRRVKQGTKIAKMGNTGRSTGIHLHFEVRVNGEKVNPLRFLPVR
ncbi:MAG: hypothetical protein COB67_12630 [SAR324 cluster bacterium]|uniref:LysM domain-containing protein n=1 Tax=SAR324 cluster bacterium TaxID=2024889 RepID=A0A2A4SRW1_9DELT|nr:MAG: hypothetical protein COB67_12630 [SAR324 cluster bacterium]